MTLPDLFKNFCLNDTTNYSYQYSFSYSKLGSDSKREPLIMTAVSFYMLNILPVTQPTVSKNYV